MIQNLKQNKYFLVFLIAISDIVASIETEINIPSFPEMLIYYNTTEGYLQWVVNANFLGICLASLFYGPISDRFGRRKPLIIGYLLFAIGSIGCVLALNNLNVLIAFRFIQGIGLSSIYVIGLAIIFDVFNKEEAAKIIGYLSSTITLGMACSPILGSFITIEFGWKYNFYIIAFLVLTILMLKLVFLKETNNHQSGSTQTLTKIFQEYIAVCNNGISMGSLIIISCAYCAYMVYIANLSLILVKYLGVREAVYGYYQSFTLIVYALFSFCCGRLIKYLGYVFTRSIGIYLTFLGSILFFLVAIYAGKSALLITLAMGVIAIGHAFILSIVFSDFMEVNKMHSGVASSFNSCFRLMYTALGIYVTGKFFNGTIMPVAITVLIMGGLSTIVYCLIYRNTRLPY